MSGPVYSGPSTPDETARRNRLAIANAEKVVKQLFKDQPVSDEVSRALAVGEFVIDVPSIKYLNKGFKFYTKNQLGLDELLKLKIKTRWIAVVGDFNAGKTFFSCLMMDRPIAADLVIRTPGITVMLSEKVEEEKKAIVAPTIQQKPEALVKELAMLGMKAKRAKNPQEKEAIENQIKEKEENWKSESTAAQTVPLEDNEHQCAFAILDTAGDDRPCSFSEQADVSANEMVKRGVIVQTAQTMVFLTCKFDRDSQEKLSCLKQQMIRLKKPASPTNRIFVVHNCKEANTKEILENNIKEVQKCYPLERTPDVEDWGWEVDRDQGVTFYLTQHCVHVFLVKHHTNRIFAGVPADLDGEVHNLETLKRLKFMIRNIIPTPVAYPILATFTQNITTQLPLFLKSPQWIPEYSRFYPLEVSPGVVILCPLMLPTMHEDPEYWNGRKEDTCWLDEIAAEGILEKMAEKNSEQLPFELSKFRIASGLAVSDCLRELNGSWFVSEDFEERHGSTYKKLAVVVQGVTWSTVAQLTPDNFRVRFFPTKGELHLSIKLPRPTPPEGWKSHNEAPVLPDNCWGVFTCKFPQNFILDGRSIQSFYNPEFLEVVDGALHIHLAFSLEDDEM